MANDKPALGYIGLGLMGGTMVLRLLAAGCRVTVWNRTPEKCAAALAAGAGAAASPAAVTAAADIVMTCLTDQNAVEAVVFGPHGIAAAGAPDKLLIDFSSIAPDRHRAMAARLRADSGMGWLDAPVSGGVPGAEAGTLAIMAGGAEEDVARARPVVAHLAARFTHMGGPGAGQVTKLINQIIVCNNIVVLAEAVALASKGGVDATRLTTALKGGWADSIPFQVFVPRMAAEGDHAPLGTLNTMMKDVDNARAFADDVRGRLPMTDAAAAIYRRLIDAGLGEAQIEAIARNAD